MVWAMPTLAVITVAHGLQRRRRRGARGPSASWVFCEETTLPSWMKEPPAKDPSRKEKIQTYEAAQVSPAALSHNLALVKCKSSTTRLVSYNLHFHRDSQMKPNLKRVLDVLKVLDADVVALQEAGLPPGLEKGGFKCGESDQNAELLKSADVSGNVEALTRQMFQETQQEVVGSGSTEHEGSQLLEGLRQLGYTYCIYSPGFYSGGGQCFCGNIVASRHPMTGEAVILDRNRFNEERSAAVATFHEIAQEPVTVVSTHLDVWAEMRGFFGMAEGEAIRLLEFEALHQALRSGGTSGGTSGGHVAILGDFNTASQSSVLLSQEHQRLADLLDNLSLQRDPQALRHFLPRSSPRLPQEMTALGFAEKLGYRHAWQELPQPMAPYYSHWSGQLIDHCLLKPRVAFVGVYHSDASDHLPLVIDLEF
ncbi:unnamed protein product [Cladocopium goreaui]|uniref:Endonuclease/exonuclease/phosphatase domain-containing protein n=1 Tax=Cladocopium goreaui TaxID=2562237 RepID=A0A9P1BHM0_9DINO|nr:unnamed protein product [Cladocopium goreaui]